MPKQELGNKRNATVDAIHLNVEARLIKLKVRHMWLWKVVRGMTECWMG